MIKILSALKEIPPKAIMIAVAIIIMVHLGVLTYYTQQHRFTQHQQRRSAVIQQMMNIIHMVQATPRNQLAQAINALEQSTVKVTLSNQPKWKLCVTELTFWRINRIIPHDAHEIEVSLHLDDGRWLNIRAIIISVDIWSQLFLLLFEALITAIVLFYAWSISRFTNPLK